MPSNNIKMKRSAKSFLWAIIFIVIAAVLSFYITRWLEGDTDIEINLVDNYLVSEGATEVYEELVLDVKNITYSGTQYNSLRIISFLIAVDDTRNLKKDTRFAFVEKESKRLEPDAALDINYDTTTPIDVLVDWRRSDIPDTAPGFRLNSALPGESRVKVTLIINTEKYPYLSESEIDLKLLAPGGDIVVKPLQRILSFSAASFALWIILSVSVWGLAWCGLNIMLGNYSTGARMVFWIMKKVGISGFIPEKYIKEQKLKKKSNRVQ